MRAGVRVSVNVWTWFRRPEYLFRPRQVGLRILRSFQKNPNRMETVKLPWGVPIEVNPREYIGSVIWHRGVFDLIVLEALARLIQPGEIALDVGANMGQMTSLMALGLGPMGTVHAFEPHPDLFSQLKSNLCALETDPRCSRIVLHNLALSDFQGRADLFMDKDWTLNQGTASLRKIGNAQQQVSLEVEVARLDDVLDPRTFVGVCKLDAEGHEQNVLLGAAQRFNEGTLRDVIFECKDPYPAPIHRFLASHGFELFSLQASPFRPKLRPPESSSGNDRQCLHTNFLATLDPERAIRRFRPVGWQCLRRFPR